MVDSEDITLEKMKTQELSLEINALSDTFIQNATFTEFSLETPQIQAVDPFKKSKPKFKKIYFACQKNNHSVSTCSRRLNMLKESKPQSKSPTRYYYKHCKTPFNKQNNQKTRFRSRSNRNHYRRFFGDSRYKSRSQSHSNSRSK